VLATKSWASLEDGTPLVTGERRGKGLVSLFHISADMRWSDLPLSGTFVEMLRRIVDISGYTSNPGAGVAGETGTETVAPLRTLDGTPGVLGVLGADFTIEFLRETLNPLERYVVLVDDAEMLADAPNAHILERIILTGRDADHGLILAGPTADLSRCYSGFIPTALKSRSGVLVAVETPDDGGLFGVRLPRNAGPGPTGRGLLVRPGTIAPVQLALPD